MGAHEPRRRCVGCGRVAPKSQLMRIALADRRLAGDGDVRARPAVHDLDGTMPGRGAYLCQRTESPEPVEACLALATRRGAFARALRCAVTLDPKIVESVKRVAQPAEGRSAGPLAISKS